MPSPCLRFSLLLLLSSIGCTAQPVQGQVVPENGHPFERPQAQDVFRVQHFGTSDGLPDNRITVVHEDRLGLLWIGTATGGLVRYDGYSFTAFRPRQGDSTSIGGMGIWVMHEDAKGDLWVGGDPDIPQGFSRYDRRMESFIRYRHDPAESSSLIHDGVSAIHSSMNEPGVIWITARGASMSGLRDLEAANLSTVGGLSRLDLETGAIENYPFDPTDLGSYPYISGTIVEDHDGIQWWGGWGINRRDPSVETGRKPSFSTFLPDADVAPTDAGPRRLSNLVNTVYEAPTEPGVLWVGGQRGLHRFEVASESFISFYPSPGDLHDVRNRVNAVFEDRSGTLWVGTGDGLFTFDRQIGRFTRFVHQPITPEVWAITQDRFGIFWVGSHFGGLMRLERRSNPFDVHEFDPSARSTVGAVYTDREGRIWLGKTNQLLRIDRTTETVTPFHHDPDDPASLGFGRTLTMYEDRSGAVWLAGSCSGEGRPSLLSWLDRETERFTHYLHDPDDPTSISDGCVNAVLEDQRGALWVIVWRGGLNRLDRETGRFTRYQHDPGDPRSLVNDYVLHIYEDASGLLWLGTEDGLSRFDAATETFTNYGDDRLMRVMMTREDRSGRFWIATAGHGLHRFDRDTGQIKATFTTDDGLGGNVVWSVFEDRRGLLWLSTDHGISQFDPESETFVTYTTRDGLPFDVFQEAGHHQSQDGELFFSGQGAVSFFPDQLQRDLIPPNVVLTSLRIAGTPAGIGPGAPLEASITMTESVTLSYEQNDLAFDYVGLHSLNPSQNRYRYRLEGYDRDWVEAGTQRTARYPRLPHGDYIFRVNAASSEGVWNEAGASVRVTISPPWWRTIWAYLLYGMLFIAGVILVDRIQRRRLLAKERARAALREQQLEQENARQLKVAYDALEASMQDLTRTQDQLIHAEKMASLGQLTAGIAHEIKNPLNFVNNFAGLSAELLDELGHYLERAPRQSETHGQDNPRSPRDDSESSVVLPLRGGAADGEAPPSLDDALETLDALKRNAELIERHGRRADGIVRAMMAHASGGSGERQATDLNELVSEHIDLAYHGKRAQVPELRVEIRRDLAAEVGKIEIVPQEIGRVLLNLLGNAFDAILERDRIADADFVGTLNVGTLNVEHGVEVRVADNGPGIPRDVQAKIFEPFFTTKPAGTGTGLGLSLSYDIVTQGHGGTLEVKSEKGKGATFIVTLPVKKEGASSNT